MSETARQVAQGGALILAIAAYCVLVAATVLWLAVLPSIGALWMIGWLK